MLADKSRIEVSDMQDNSKKEMQRIYEMLCRSRSQNVSGVVHIESPVPGPVVGITVCTHGNEPSGLFAVAYLLETLDIAKTLLKGSVYVVVNNVESASQFMQCGTGAKNGGRFVDIDMNRLPADLTDRADDMRYEVRRALELLPIWKLFDVGLDMHSTSIASPAMIVVVGSKFHADLAKGFPIDIVLTNIDGVQKGKPASAFYGKGRSARVMGVEAGQHTSEAANECAKQSVRMLLENLNMLPKSETNEPVRYKQYDISGSLTLKNDTYEIVREFKTFENLPAGTVLAKGNGPNELMPFDGHVLFHNGKPRPTDPNNEALFFSKPVKYIAA